MLLAVDIGNTHTKFGLFQEDQLKQKFSARTDSYTCKEDLNDEPFAGAAFDSAIICSVVPEAEHRLARALSGRFGIEPMLVRNHLDFGLTIRYEPLQALGTDRVVNAFAAAEKYGVPCIICSLGTATTFDVVNEKRELLGGAIVPGMRTTAKALHLYTARLPEVDLKKPKSIIGSTTVEAIRSGLFYGQTSIVEGFVSRCKRELGDNPKVVATGGFASTIFEYTTVIDVVDENLTLDGLRMLYDRLGKGSAVNL